MDLLLDNFEEYVKEQIQKIPTRQKADGKAGAKRSRARG
jgi:hypothetical protein